jgi:hypothetical protein
MPIGSPPWDAAWLAEQRQDLAEWDWQPRLT